MNTEALQHFNAQLTQGISILEKLEKLLCDERDAYGRRALEQIQTFTEQKQSLLSNFLEINQQRTLLLQNLGLNADNEGVHTFISAAPEIAQATLFAAWEKQQIKLNAIQELSKVNGLVCAQNLKNTEQLLSIMSGRSHKDRIYNQKGSAGHYRAQSRLGKA